MNNEVIFLKGRTLGGVETLTMCTFAGHGESYCDERLTTMGGQSAARHDGEALRAQVNTAPASQPMPWVTSQYLMTLITQRLTGTSVEVVRYHRSL